MGEDHIKTLAKFMRTQDSRLVFVIPPRGPVHREVDLNDAVALRYLIPYVPIISEAPL